MAILRVEGSGKLQRSLGMWTIVGLGLGYMTPTVVFDTFGIVSRETDGVVPLAYLLALAVMLFTAISYGKMVRVYPSAGSSYTYTRETMHPALGFMVGWASLLDYLLLPMVNALVVRIYLVSLFPETPAWIYVVAYVAIITAINVWSMTSLSRINSTLVVFQVALIGMFLVLASTQLADGMGQGTIFTTEPLFHPNVEFAAVVTGATVVCFSFIGFDAITNYTEEARDSSTVPRAIILTVLIGGGIFFVASWFTQAVFPDISGFENTDDTLPEIGLYVGGKLFQLVFVAGAFAAAVASSLASHASVSRLLYVMGRNGILAPKRLWGYVHPRFHTPAFTVIIVGLVSLLAIMPSLELIASMINFGALIAFTFVNLCVPAHFIVREGRYRTARDVFSYLVLPLIGAGLTGLLWYYLHADAFIAGLVWCIVGFVYMLLLTNGFRTRIVTLGDESLERA